MIPYDDDKYYCSQCFGSGFVFYGSGTRDFFSIRIRIQVKKKHLEMQFKKNLGVPTSMVLTDWMTDRQIHRPHNPPPPKQTLIVVQYGIWRFIRYGNSYLYQ